MRSYFARLWAEKGSHWPADITEHSAKVEASSRTAVLAQNVAITGRLDTVVAMRPGMPFPAALSDTSEEQWFSRLARVQNLEGYFIYGAVEITMPHLFEQARHVFAQIVGPRRFKRCPGMRPYPIAHPSTVSLDVARTLAGLRSRSQVFESKVVLSWKNWLKHRLYR